MEDLRKKGEGSSVRWYELKVGHTQGVCSYCERAV
jgi:hypothetical protein